MTITAIPPVVAAQRLLQEQPLVSCNGWTYYCLCSNHRYVRDGILDQYRNALANGHTTRAEHLKSDIRRQQTNLARKVR